MSRRSTVRLVAAVTLSLLIIVGSTGIALANPAWTATYNTSFYDYNSATAVAVSPNGNTVFVTGYGSHVGGSPNEDYTTVAYKASNGNQLWAQHFTGLGGSDIPFALAVSPNGQTVFVTGSSEDVQNGDDDYATVAYRATDGHVNWKKRYDAAGLEDGATSIAVNGAGVFVTGASDDGGSGGVDYATVAYNAVTGAPLWSPPARRYVGTGGPDRPTDIAVTGTNVYVTGASKGSTTGLDYATVAYANSGTPLWSKRYARPGWDAASSIAVSGARVFVTGESVGSPNSGYDYATVAYNPTTGAPLWSPPAQRYDGPANGRDGASSIVVLGTRVFVTGGSEGSANTDADYATIAYNAANGTPAWTQRYDGPGHGFDSAVSIAAKGTRVYVTGSSEGSTTTRIDYATRAYSAATGATAWTERHTGQGSGDGGNGDDRAVSIAASPAGNKVFVTGTSWEPFPSYYTLGYLA